MSPATSTSSQLKRSQYAKEVEFISKKTRYGRSKLTPCLASTSRTPQASLSTIPTVPTPLTPLYSNGSPSNPVIHGIEDGISMPALKRRRIHVWTVCFFIP
jgi:hypothetical protein